MKINSPLTIDTGKSVINSIGNPAIGQDKLANYRIGGLEIIKMGNLERQINHDAFVSRETWIVFRI